MTLLSGLPRSLLALVGTFHVLCSLSLVLDPVAASTTDAEGPGLDISQDGTCGNGVTCFGSSWGPCCSEHGYCGSSDVYCGAGCNLAFGSCDRAAPVASGCPGPSPSPSPSSSPKPSPTPSYPVQSCQVTVTSLLWTTTQGGGSGGCPTASTVTWVSTSTTTKTSSAVRTETVTSAVTVTSPVTVTSTRTAVGSVKTETVLVTMTSVKTTTVSAVKTETVSNVSTVTVTTATTAKPSTTIKGSAAPIPSPTLPGTIKNCKTWYQAVEGDTCRTIADKYDINRNETGNGSLGHVDEDTEVCAIGDISKLNKGKCRIKCNNLWPGYYLCVEA